MVINIIEECLAPLWTTSSGRRTGWVALACSLLLTLYMLGDAVVTILNDGRITAISTVAVTLPQDHRLDQLIAQIPTWHLFGNSATGSLPITSLQLRLIGIVKSMPEEFSHIIISEAGQPGKIYKVGDVLADGVKVNAIVEDGVILENGGHLEKLPLIRPALEFGGMPKSILGTEGE